MILTNITFHFIDWVILAIVLIILGLIIYFSMFKHRKDPCHNCPFAQGCDNLKESCKKQKKH